MSRVTSPLLCDRSRSNSWKSHAQDQSLGAVESRTEVIENSLIRLSSRVFRMKLFPKASVEKWTIIFCKYRKPLAVNNGPRIYPTGPRGKYGAFLFF